jgi:mono/diheme cytochrome c family protein
MKRGSVIFLLLIFSLPLLIASAQTSNTNTYTSGPDTTQKLMSLTSSQREGAYLFKQRCNLCHGPTSMSGFQPFGLRLTKDNVEGREDAMREQIMNGSARMPGFRYGLQSSQVGLIIEYIKTLEKPKTQQKGERDNAVD